MNKIEAILKNYDNRSSMSQCKYQQKLVQGCDEVQVISKVENGYIDIEYVNQIGGDKAKMLIQMFDEHKEFYQFFLKKFRKVVIQNDIEKGQRNEIILSNEPYPICLDDLLQSVLSCYSNHFVSLIKRKIEYQEVLLSEGEALDLIRYVILKKDVDSGKIDFFEYLDLVDGKFFDVNYYYELALIDLVFECHNYSMLEQYMMGQEIESIRQNIFGELHNRYGLILLNQSLKHQKRLFDKFPDCFFKENLDAFNQLFNEQIFLIVRSYQRLESKRSISISKDATLDLAYEFLNELDSTGILSHELRENIENGTIMLWDSNNTDMRKKMQKLYGWKFNIDKPLCCFEYANEKLVSKVLNLPLHFTLDDIFELIHEFFHFHSSSVVPQMEKCLLLKETFSIYFENLVLEFLKGKGYSEQELPINYRVEDAFLNFVYISPIIYYFSYYMKAGRVDLDYLHSLIRRIEEGTLMICDKLGLSGEKRKKELERNGIFDSIEFSTFNLIYNINNILLRNDESIYCGSPYVFGTIISKFAMENQISPALMLQFCDDLNKLEDPCEVMQLVGIDLDYYGFKHKISVNKGERFDNRTTELGFGSNIKLRLINRL